MLKYFHENLTNIIWIGNSLTEMFYKVKYFLQVKYLKKNFVGLPCGSPNQVSSLPWTIQLLPNQALLHLKHPYHLTGNICITILFSRISMVFSKSISRKNGAWAVLCAFFLFCMCCAIQHLDFEHKKSIDIE